MRPSLVLLGECTDYQAKVGLERSSDPLAVKLLLFLEAGEGLSSPKLLCVCERLVLPGAIIILLLPIIICCFSHVVLNREVDCLINYKDILKAL